MNKLDASDTYPGNRMQPAILCLMVLAVYGVSLVSNFVWDDNIFFIGNAVYKNFNLRGIFFSLANGVEYLPLRDLTYAVDYLVWGEHPLGFHLTNLLFFAANVHLVYMLTGLLTKRIVAISGKSAAPFVPFAVAAGFALHPINAEVVNFITCRNVLVSGLFFFLSCIGIIRFFDESAAPSAKWYLASLLAFVGAMLGKATAIMLPLLFLAVLPIVYPGRLKRIFRCLVPFFAVAALFFVIFKSVAVEAGFVDKHATELTLFNLEDRVVLAVQIPFFYLKKLFIPYGFGVDYQPEFATRILSPKVLLMLLLLAVSAVAGVRFRRRFPGVVIGLCWFIVALLPVLNLFGTNPVVADRYAYLPTYGIMLSVALSLDSLLRSRLKTPTAGALLLLLAGLSFARSLDWRSDETLWRANIGSYPDNTKSYINLAVYYVKNEQYQRALDLLAANKSVPGLIPYYYYYKGHYLYKQQKLAEAKQVFEYLLDNVDSELICALYYLGFIAEYERDLPAAVRYYNRAIASKGYDPFLHVRLAKARIKEIKRTWLDQYVAAMKQKIDRDPRDLNTRRELALFLDNLGYYEEALEQYLYFERNGVKNWQIKQNIANCYFNMGRNREAITYYQKVRSLGGSSETVLNSLGTAYRRVREYDKSIEVLTEGARTYPSSSFTAFNLAMAYFEAGRKDLARNAFVEVEQKFPDLKDKTTQYIQQLSSRSK